MADNKTGDKTGDKAAGDNGGTDERAELKEWFHGVLDEWLTKHTQTRTGTSDGTEKKTFLQQLFS